MALSRNTSLLIPDSFESLLQACISYRAEHSRGIVERETIKNRTNLSSFIVKFHTDCRTFDDKIRTEVNKLNDPNCILLMTAHQPNLFAYSGVLRKAVLLQELKEQLETRLNLPVVSFFGLADQDFANDRWFQSSLLPAIVRKGGTLTLRAKLPTEKIVCKLPPPSKEEMEQWRKDIEKWMLDAIRSIGRPFKKTNDHELMRNWQQRTNKFIDNFEEFWKLAEECQETSTNFSDFNAFLMSRIVNSIWGCSILFARYSECQQIFTNQFEFLLSKYDSYSQTIHNTIKATDQSAATESPNLEPNLVPFWYHCECGSKARLTLEKQGIQLVGHGQCAGCNKTYELSLGTSDKPDVSSFCKDISARAIPMTLVFFKGLDVACYVTGMSGLEYMKQAKLVGESLGISFPPIALWRPHDRYVGIGQMNALLEFQRIVENIDLLEFPEENTRQKSRMNRIRDQTEDLRIIKNVSTSLDLVPSIVDYAINIGLAETVKQWNTHLSENGDLRSDIRLDSLLMDLFVSPNPNLKISNSLNQ